MTPSLMSTGGCPAWVRPIFNACEQDIRDDEISEDIQEEDITHDEYDQDSGISFDDDEDSTASQEYDSEDWV